LIKRKKGTVQKSTEKKIEPERGVVREEKENPVRKNQGGWTPSSKETGESNPRIYGRNRDRHR